MNAWGHLANRYGTREPRKMLALDGGGIRGLITLEMLARLEELLADRSPSPDEFRLCQYFDYIGGTSTGAIIAAGLARGMSVGELRNFYVDAGPSMFDKRFLLRRLKSFYKREPLAEMLQDVFGAGTTLMPEHLQCLLLIVTKNVTTDSPWPISSNPQAKYNAPDREDCNLRIPLWQLVRASTAAPVYFPPEVMNWDPDDPEKTFVFVDGGVTPYNNPAFLLYRMATHPAYGLNWESGEDRLLIVSFGTGAAPDPVANEEAEERGLVGLARSLPGSLLYAMQIDQDINCRAVGRCSFGAPIDRELGDMIPRKADGTTEPLTTDTGREFLYVRYNARLDDVGLHALGLPDISPAEVQKMDSVDFIDELSRVGQAAARQIQPGHLGTFLPLV